jgi:thiol-disulfide isomerase/thioredoxin
MGISCLFRFRRTLALATLLSVASAVSAQDFIVYDSIPQLESRIKQAGDGVLIINFWATWCKPCVEELPCFDELREHYAAQNVQVLLVSLDFRSQLEKKFIPFLRNQKLKSEVVLLADQDVNTWIPRIHDAWDGAIPATLVLKGRKRDFNLGKFDNFEDLEKFVRPFLDDSSALIIRKPLQCNGGK